MPFDNPCVDEPAAPVTSAAALLPNYAAQDLGFDDPEGAALLPDDDDPLFLEDPDGFS